ncbi:NUDIX domain-containing protein [Pseudonocardia nigra]|uniref:NUDIX domain-containing protein n=1 Tax=Pseudonocardia nigra TaxID=1921578 RepID=UPI001C602A5C|nr:NUDIX hydrolase [Pseudonocardia nigra]
MDPHFAHLAEGNARQARKRVAADVLIRDGAGRVLLVDPTYKEGWDLPGGMVEANESPQSGALRELDEELGLAPTLGRPLVIEWVGAHGPWDDQIVFVFDGGVIPETEVSSIQVRDREIADWRFFDVDSARGKLREHIGRRLQAAVDSLENGSIHYLEREL